MKKVNSIKLFIFLSFFLFLCPLKVFAATIGFSGNDRVYAGENVTVYMYVPDGVTSVSGNLSFDGNTLEYVSGDKIYSGFQGGVNPGNNYRVSGVSGDPTTSQVNVFQFTFKAKKTGSAVITLNGAKLSNASGNIDTNVAAKTISIVDPPSGNNDLSNLTTNVGGLKFTGATSYDITVENNITSIDVSATAADSNAKVSGTGTKSLNYGKNVINITVKAENGSEKTYTINVVRKDNRSNNNNLASLKVNGGELSPGFNKNTTSYSLSVPYSVSSLNVNAKAEDDKAKVSVSNTNLTAEETTDVKVVVTAENGSSKTYIIHTLRGKDPNKVLSTNNYLASLIISDGLLSPGFSKEQTSYIVYLPYEVENIELNYSVEDTKYATVSKEGPDKLSVGNNLYKLIVTAEDESKKEYSITVVRGKNLLESDLSSNVYLKKIKVKGGKLNQFFDKKIGYYTYTGGKVEAIAEDENSKVKIIENDKVISILVEAESGDIGVYTLVPAEHHSLNIVIIVISFIAIVFSFIVGFIIGKEKSKPSEKKEKKLKKKNKKVKEDFE